MKNKKIIAFSVFIVWSIMFYFVAYNYYQANNSSAIMCECSNKNWEYWPEWEKCLEQMEQTIWPRWYYWELKYENKKYYYTINCK